MERSNTLITNIQKYSLHDGDGIRTTVFFKGCPLRCMWCHNPETQKFTKQALTNQERCTGCGECIEACPSSAVILRDGKAVTDQDSCQACGTCETYCLNNLREIAGREYTVRELVRELKKDEMFYEESGGGVTLSGGEVMCMDMDYIEQLAKELYRQGITVTIDTCGFAPYDSFRRILQYVDTFLYDVKMIDGKRHKHFTGVDNCLILENLKRLSEEGARIYIRIPVIKGVNADDESMQTIASWLLENKILLSQINLLAYHNTGSSKYARLETEYKGEGFAAPTGEEMEHFKEIFEKSGIHNIKIGG